MIETFLAQVLGSVRDFSVDSGLIQDIKTFSAISTIILGALFILILVKFSSLRRQQGELSVTQELGRDIVPPTPAPIGAYRARWEEVLKHMDSTRETEWKFAILEADKLMDLVLKRAGFPGDTIGERLMEMQEGTLANLQGLWAAHKIRNKVAHELDYFLRYSEARQAIGYYEAALLELEAI